VDTEHRVASRTFRSVVVILALGFSAAFIIVVVPQLIRDSGDILGGLAAGFVNPYSSGYSLDIFFCWAVLAVWIAWERVELGVRHGWICLILGFMPGVATGFATYLLLRHRQVAQPHKLESVGR
jgi:hypothetical protein